MSILEKGAAADNSARRPDNAADKFSLLAYTQLLRRQQKGARAFEAAKNALGLSKRAQDSVPGRAGIRRIRRDVKSA